MLLHSACLELDGVGVLISARDRHRQDRHRAAAGAGAAGARFLSDDMTVLQPDGRVGCFPKPLTISHHTLRAIGNEELTTEGVAAAAAAEPAALQGGPPVRHAARPLNIPIMGMNALTQFIVPPPKYTVDRLCRRCRPARDAVGELFVI